MTLSKLRHIPTWQNRFLIAIKNGYNDKTAANISGVGTAEIRRRIDRDPKFKAEYEEASKNQKERPRGGAW